jgi:hypothetical protein
LCDFGNCIVSNAGSAVFSEHRDEHFGKPRGTPPLTRKLHHNSRKNIKCRAGDLCRQLPSAGRPHNCRAGRGLHPQQFQQSPSPEPAPLAKFYLSTACSITLRAMAVHSRLPSASGSKCQQFQMFSGFLCVSRVRCQSHHFLECCTGFMDVLPLSLSRRVALDYQPFQVAKTEAVPIGCIAASSIRHSNLASHRDQLIETAWAARPPPNRVLAV